MGVGTGCRTDESHEGGPHHLSKDLKVTCQPNGCLGDENSRQRDQPEQRPRDRTVSGMFEEQEV